MVIFSKEKHLMPTHFSLFTSHLCDLRKAAGDIVIHHVVSEWWSNTCSYIIVTDLIDYYGASKSRL